MASFHGLRPSNLSRFLHIALRDVKYSVSEQELHQVFDPYGATKVQMCAGMTTVVSFPTMSQATRAGLEMQGRCIYTNCCWMQIQFAPEQVVTLATGTAAQASRTPMPTPVAAPRSASQASVCVLDSPVPSPSAITAADEEKPVMASWAELQAELEHILAKFALMDVHDAAVASSMSTTTTSPPTVPVQAVPPPTTTPIAEPTSATIIETAHGAVTAVPSVDVALTPATPAACSMKCRDDLTKVQKAAGPPATPLLIADTSVVTPANPPAAPMPLEEDQRPPWPPPQLVFFYLPEYNPCLEKVLALWNLGEQAKGMAYSELLNTNRELEIRQPWPPPLHVWKILKGHLFRPRPLTLIKCNLEGLPTNSPTVRSWLGLSARLKSCVHSPDHKYLLRVKLLPHPPGDPLCKLIFTGYHGGSVNCYLVQASEQEKHLFYSADGQVPHIMLQLKGGEMQQLITQPGKYLSLFLQPKPPWLFILTQPDTHVEEKGVHAHGEVMTLNSEIVLAALESYVRQLIGDCLCRTLYQEELYYGGNMILPEAKQPDYTCGTLLDHHSGLGSVILGILVTRPPFSMVIMASLQSGYKLFTTPFFIWRTSAACIPNSLAQFQSKVAGQVYRLSNYCSVTLIGLQLPENLITQGWIYEAHKNNYIKLSPSDHSQDGTKFTVEQLSYPTVQYNASDAFHFGGENHARQQLFKKKFGGVAFIPIFLDGKGLASYLCGTSAFNSFSASAWNDLEEERFLLGLHIYSTCVWLSFPWNPGLHTWLWCCCRMHERQAPNSVYGCDLLEQSSCGSSWQVEAWTHAFLYRKYDAEAVNQIAEEMLLPSWIKFNGNALIGSICLGFYYLQRYVHLAIVLCLVHACQFINIHQKTWDPGGIFRTSFAASLYIGLHQVNYDKDLGYSSPDVPTCSLTISDLQYIHWQRVLYDVSSEPFDSGVHQILLWTIYQQPLPWDPGGNFQYIQWSSVHFSWLTLANKNKVMDAYEITSAWGQAEIQGRGNVMYSAHATHSVQPRSSKLAVSTLQPSRLSPTRTWLCPAYRARQICKVESGELGLSMMNYDVAVATFPFLSAPLP